LTVIVATRLAGPDANWAISPALSPSW
jgi:hypothetical protein